jgi:hypothetical protein
MESNPLFQRAEEAEVEARKLVAEREEIRKARGNSGGLGDWINRSCGSATRKSNAASNRRKDNASRIAN